MKYLFWYLKGTSSYKLIYEGSNDLELFQTYSDVSHSGCKESGWSTGGYTIIVCSGTVGWSLKHQPFVILSSTETEYVAAVEAGKEIK